MAKKYRLTGCSKFLLFLIIAGPIAFLGAYYINTGDPMSGLHALGIGVDEKEKTEIVEDKAVPSASVEDLQMQVRELTQALEECQTKNDSTKIKEE